MKRIDSQIQAAVFLGPIIIGSYTAILLPHFGTYGLLAFTLILIGLICLIYAKVSEKVRSRNIISWGPAGMTSKEKWLYLSGYGLLVISIAITLLLRMNS